MNEVNLKHRYWIFKVSGDSEENHGGLGDISFTTDNRMEACIEARKDEDYDLFDSIKKEYISTDTVNMKDIKYYYKPNSNVYSSGCDFADGGKDKTVHSVLDRQGNIIIDDLDSYNSVSFKGHTSNNKKGEGDIIKAMRDAIESIRKL